VSVRTFDALARLEIAPKSLAMEEVLEFRVFDATVRRNPVNVFQITHPGILVVRGYVSDRVILEPHDKHQVSYIPKPRSLVVPLPFRQTTHYLAAKCWRTYQPLNICLFHFWPQCPNTLTADAIRKSINTATYCQSHGTGRRKCYVSDYGLVSIHIDTLWNVEAPGLVTWAGIVIDAGGGLPKPS